jgi:hypothetical protein
MTKPAWDGPAIPERMDPETFSNYSEDTLYSRNHKNTAVNGFKSALTGVYLL